MSILFFLASLTVTAQTIPRCGTLAPTMTVDTSPKRDLSHPRSTVFVPVVVHIVWNSPQENLSDELILSQIEVLNEDYNMRNEDLDMVPARFEKNVGNPGISFCLASMDPNGQPTSGIVRVQTDRDDIGSLLSTEGRRRIKHSDLGGSSAWDVSLYLNIWVGDRSDFLGDATFPIGEDHPAGEEGIVIRYDAFGRDENAPGPFNRGRTLTHEVAHFFNVQHLFGSDLGCNTDDDFIADTPFQSGPYFGCESVDGAQSCGSFDMASNFLNFRDDACMHYFTRGQAERMMNALFTYRYELVASRICNTNSVIPDNPLKVAQIVTRDGSFDISIRPLTGSSYDLALFDMSGRKIRHDPHNEEARHTIEGLVQGIYIVVLHYGERSFARKVFVP